LLGDGCVVEALASDELTLAVLTAWADDCGQGDL
jgi:hypothetical protein